MAPPAARLGCAAVSLLLLLGVASSELLLPLDKHAWTLENENGTLAIRTSIPAYPLEVLRSAGVIEDPLYRYGEMESRWVAMETWTFSTTISARDVDELLAQQQVVLQLDGVDTYADVLINGEKVAETISFHRQFNFPVKGALRPGQPNTLAIAIRSAYKTSLSNKAAYPYHIPTLYNTGSIGAYNFARKPAFDFGWDWGPAFAASGLHGSVKLVGFSQPTLASAALAQTATEDGFKLVVTANFWVPPVDTKGYLTVSLPELKLSQQQELAFSGSALTASALTQVPVEAEFDVPKDAVQLWWPAGGNYGPHKLYDVQLQYSPDADGTCAGASVLRPAKTQSRRAAAAAAAEEAEAQEPAESYEDEAAGPEEEAEGEAEAAAEQQQEEAGPAAGRSLLAAGAQVHVDPMARVLTPSTFATFTSNQQQQQPKAPAAAPATAAPAVLPPAAAVAAVAQPSSLPAAAIDTVSVAAAAADAEQQLQKPLPQPEQPAAAPAGKPAGAVLKDLLSVIGTTLKNLDTASAGSSDAAQQPEAAAAQQCSVLTKRVGFRTIELVMQPLPQAVQALFGDKRGFDFTPPRQRMNGILNRDGAGQWANNADGEWTHFPGDDVEVDGAVPESFYFRVNGLPIFMKGANVIPLSVLPSNTTKELIEATLQAAVDSNQNMLRVWGGGLYHPEAFYDFCDENGLLIWQDAMFGGSHYPRTPEWIANYAAEITQQAQRLSWHPSVALWCGNNEIDLSYEWSNSTVLRSNRNMFVVDYQAVFIDTVRKAIKTVNPATIFVDSSPFKGAVVDTPELYIKRWGFIGDPRYGTIHSYNYMSDCEDFRSYPLGKFVSEFGWQSYPLPETYAAAMDPEKDWGVGNPMNEFRNRRTDVTPQFLQQYAKHFKLPADWNPADPEERMKRFRSYLWIGNMQHARCYETALNFWRRLRSNSKSLTMGVMYWQLNDIWAGASWSSIDVAGRWKPVHYAVKRAYAPLALQAVMDGGQVQLFVVSDLAATTPTRITLRLVSLADGPASCSATKAGSKPAAEVGSFDYDVPGLFATRVWRMEASELLKARPGCTAATCFLSVTAEAPGVEPSESQLWFTQFKNMELPDPKISITDVRIVSPVEAQLTVRSERPAPLVMLSAGGERVGHFTDNGFTLEPCAPRTVTFIAHDAVFTKREAANPAALFSAESLFDHSRWADVKAKGGTAAKAGSTGGASSSSGGGGAGSKNGPAQ